MVLTSIDEAALAAGVERAAAAAGLRVLNVTEPNQKHWRSAAAVVVDVGGARRSARAGVPRRGGIVVVAAEEPSASVWSAAIDVGAQHVYVLSAQDAELVRTLSEAAEAGREAARRGRVVAVTAGRGGSGASVFSAAIALCAEPALLVDLDPYGGGNDLIVGAESVPGLRWPDVGAQAGRLNWPAVREALPRRGGVSVLSSARTYHDIDPASVAVIAEAGQRGGATVVCDVPRQLGAAGNAVVEISDLVVVVTACDVRGIAGASAVAGVLRTLNPHVGLVIRGPAPGGLSPRSAADLAGIPLLAAMRPEPSLAQRLEQGGLRLRSRSPLVTGARRVLAALAPGAVVGAA